MYRTFYNIVRVGYPVEPEKAVELDTMTIVDELLSRLKEEREYLGLIDDAGTTLQMMYDGDLKYWVEVPCPEKGGSYGKYFDISSARELLLGLSGRFPKDGYAGFEFKSW